MLCLPRDFSANPDNLVIREVSIDPIPDPAFEIRVMWPCNFNPLSAVVFLKYYKMRHFPDPTSNFKIIALSRGNENRDRN